MIVRRTPPGRPTRSSVLWMALLIGGVLFCGGTPAQAQRFGADIPSAIYFNAFGYFYDGRYDDALKVFQRELRGAIKTPQSRWIDSICYHTMIGECYYQVGRLEEAQNAYTSALRLYLAFPNWMIRVQFPVAIRPTSSVRKVPWGTSARQARLGHYPDTMGLGQGRIDNSRQWRFGGVVQQALIVPVHVQEIVRCTSLAIRRRTELLGPLAQYDPMTGDLIAALSRGPAPPNHWSQAWIDVQLGLALAAGGKHTEALLRLNRSLVAAGEWDHPLTAMALLEMGKLALERGDYPDAVRFCHEASITALHYFDAGILEEAFRYGAVAHLISGGEGIFDPLPSALAWAKVKRLRQMQVSVLLSMAENLTALGRTSEAISTLDDAKVALGRRASSARKIKARLDYLRAAALFQQGKTAAGESAFVAAMSYMRHGSHWMHQIRQIDRHFSAAADTRGPFTPRTAMDVYSVLLRDPGAADWRLRPMESLAVLKTPHSASLEHWFLVALQRKDHEKAMEIADRARRHRYFSSLNFGGRLQSLRWILEAPENTLDRGALLQRQGLLTQYPAYRALSQQARQIRTQLLPMGLVTASPEAARRQSKALGELSAVSAQQETALCEMALRREPTSLIFPPLRSTKQIRESLPPGHAMLAFFTAAGDLYGFLLNRENYGYWRVGATSLLTKRIADLLRQMGNYDQNRMMALDDLADEKWKETARQVLDNLLEGEVRYGAAPDFTQPFSELVIVPDGVLWYLPFEALQVQVSGQLHPLLQRFRIRYMPIASLIAAHRSGVSPAGQTAVVLGQSFPHTDASVTRAAFEKLARVVPRAVALGGQPLPAASSVYVSLVDQLVVLDDLVVNAGAPYGWMPIQIDRGKPGNTLSDWLALPLEGPKVVVLPGFHTAAESALKNIDRSALGDEVFLAVCGLMSAGAETALISRWRTGGQSSLDAVREFVQELPHTSPADAWQRAFLVTAAAQLDPEAEPRLKASTTDDPPKAEHPFFWAGYMLVDSGVAPDRAEPPPGLDLAVPNGIKAENP